MPAGIVPGATFEVELPAEGATAAAPASGGAIIERAAEFIWSDETQATFDAFAEVRLEIELSCFQGAFQPAFIRQPSGASCELSQNARPTPHARPRTPCRHMQTCSRGHAGSLASSASNGTRSAA